MNVVLHDGTELAQDIWACVFPSVKRFVHEEGAPYGLGNAMEYIWGDSRVDLEITIKVWRASDGIHAKRVT